MKDKLNVVVVLFLLVFLSGCGGAQIKGDFLNQSWLNDSIPISNQPEIPVKLYLSKFSLGNEITNPYLIGEAKTGALNSKSEVISDIPIQDIFYNALKDIFKKKGFIITGDQNSADLLITGEIQQFWVREYASGWTPEYAKAAVRFDILFKDSNNKVFWANSIDKEVKSNSLGSIFDATGSLLPTLKEALSQSIKQVINDSSLQAKLNKLIESKKQPVDVP